MRKKTDTTKRYLYSLTPLVRLLKKRRRMGRIKEYFLDKGLTARDIPLAFACVLSLFSSLFSLLSSSSEIYSIIIGWWWWWCWRALIPFLSSLTCAASTRIKQRKTTIYVKTGSTKSSPSRSPRPRGSPRTAFNRQKRSANRLQTCTWLKTTSNRCSWKCWKRLRNRRAERWKEYRC